MIPLNHKERGDYMICEKCGEQLELDDRFCTNCGAAITQRPIVQQTYTTQQQLAQPIYQQQLPNYNVVVNQNINAISIEDNKKANLLCIISLLLYILGPVAAMVIAIIISYLSENASFIVSGLSGLCRIAAYVIVIITRIKYPKNTFGKVLMWVYLGLFIAGIVMTILLLILLFIGFMSLLGM